MGAHPRASHAPQRRQGKRPGGDVLKDNHGHNGGMLAMFLDIEQRWRAWYLGIAEERIKKSRKVIFHKSLL